MCATCGCPGESGITLTDLRSGSHFHLDGGELSHSHDHAHSHAPEHSHGLFHFQPKVLPAASGPSTAIRIEHELLSKNDRLAEQNRGWLAARATCALNLMSSPGAGKTTLLERTIHELGAELGISVIEGDQATTHDGERIRAAGASVIQVNTGAGCHLDANMVARALRQLDPPPRSLVLVENVGNLVCPAMFDLGEQARVVVASVAEGDDKPAKYPHMFRRADVIVLNKIDLLPHVNFREDAFCDAAHALNPAVRILPVSATCGDGLDAWFNWLREVAGRAPTAA